MEQEYHFAVQGFSLRRGTFTTLFAPYKTKEDADRMADDLREKNPQIKYRVVSRYNEERNEYNRDLALRIRNGQVGSGMKFRG